MDDSFKDWLNRPENQQLRDNLIGRGRISPDDTPTEEPPTMHDQHDDSPDRTQFIVVGSIIGAVLLLGLIFGFSTAERIDAAQGGVELRNGRYVDTHGPGLKWRFPGVYKWAIYETAMQSLEIGGQEGFKSDYRDTPIELTTADGIPVQVFAYVQYRTPLESLEDLYTVHKARDSQQVNDKIVQPETRDAIRDVLSQKTIQDIWPSGYEVQSQEIATVLSDKLSERGVELLNFNLTFVNPSDAYEEAVRQQVEQQQEAQRQAEIVKVREQEAEQKRVTAKGEADAEVIRAQGEAEANTIRAESLTPEILQAMYYETLTTINWAIFGPDDVQPVMPISTPEPVE